MLHETRKVVSYNFDQENNYGHTIDFMWVQPIPLKRKTESIL